MALGAQFPRETRVNGYRPPMSHKPRIPGSLENPGITSRQCWVTLTLSAVVGALFACASSAYAGLIAAWLTQAGMVLLLWAHRRRALLVAYHAQRRGRAPR